MARAVKEEDSFDLIEAFDDWSLSSENKPLSRYQQRHFKELLESKELKSYKEKKSTYILRFSNDRRIHFAKDQLRAVRALITGASRVAELNREFIDSI